MLNMCLMRLKVQLSMDFLDVIESRPRRPDQWTIVSIACGASNTKANEGFKLAESGIDKHPNNMISQLKRSRGNKRHGKQVPGLQIYIVDSWCCC